MLFSIKHTVSLVLLLEFASTEWVEIKQFSNKKTFLGVTPFSEYIYTPSLVFTSTTETYDRMPLPKPKGYVHMHEEMKKPISTIPETFLMKTTIEPPPPITRVTPAPPTTARTKQKKKQHFHHQQPYPGWAVKPNKTIRRNEDLKTRPVSVTITKVTTPSTIEYKPKHKSTTSKPHIANKDFHINVSEDDDEFVSVDDEHDDTDFETDPNNQNDDYELVYDDTEDDIDVDPETGDFVAEDLESDRKGDHHPSEYEYYDDDEEYYEDDDIPEAEMKSKGSAEDSINGYSYAKFLPYIKTIQSTLIRNSHQNNVNNKLTFLSDIKDRLLYAIQSKINSIWPSRVKRDTSSNHRGDMWDSWDKGGGHGMDFPSNEGALLTLAFLTFAVFLIKCILKLIHAIKGKHDKSVIPIIIANGTASTPTVAPMTLRLKRDLDPIEIANFMHKLESFNPH